MKNFPEVCTIEETDEKERRVFVCLLIKAEKRLEHKPPAAEEKQCEI